MFWRRPQPSPGSSSYASSSLSGVTVWTSGHLEEKENTILSKARIVGSLRGLLVTIAKETSCSKELPSLTFSSNSYQMKLEYMVSSFICALQSNESITSKFESIWSMIHEHEHDVASLILKPAGRNSFNSEFSDALKNLVDFERTFHEFDFLENQERTETLVYHYSRMAQGFIIFYEVIFAVLAIDINISDFGESPPLNAKKNGPMATDPNDTSSIETSLAILGKSVLTTSDREFLNSVAGLNALGQYMSTFNTLAYLLMLRWTELEYCKHYQRKSEITVLRGFAKAIDKRLREIPSVTVLLSSLERCKLWEMLLHASYNLASFQLGPSTFSLIKLEQAIKSIQQTKRFTDYMKIRFNNLMMKSAMYFYSVFSNKVTLGSPKAGIVSMVDSVITSMKKTHNAKFILIFDVSLVAGNRDYLASLNYDFVGSSHRPEPTGYMCPDLPIGWDGSDLLPLPFQCSATLATSLGLEQSEGKVSRKHHTSHQSAPPQDPEDPPVLLKPMSGMSQWPVICAYPAMSSYHEYMPDIVSILLEEPSCRSEPYFHSEKSHSYVVFKVDIAVYMALICPKSAINKDERRRLHDFCVNLRHQLYSV